MIRGGLDRRAQALLAACTTAVRYRVNDFIDIWYSLSRPGLASFEGLHMYNDVSSH